MGNGSKAMPNQSGFLRALRGSVVKSFVVVLARKADPRTAKRVALVDRGHYPPRRTAAMPGIP